MEYSANTDCYMKEKYAKNEELNNIPRMKPLFDSYVLPLMAKMASLAASPASFMMASSGDNVYDEA